MKARSIAIGAAVLVVGGILAASCGGSGNSGGSGSSGNAGSAIQTDKGLAVAAAGAKFDPRLIAAGASPGANSATTKDAAAPAAVAQSAGGNAASGVQQGYPISPLFQQNGGTGITVQGYGTATADADSAIAEFYFNTNAKPGIVPQGVPQGAPGAEGGSGSGSATTSSGSIAPGEPVPAPAPDQQTGTATPITEAALQPVIDAIVNAGVARGDIQFLNAYADSYSSSATLRVTIRSIGSVDAVVQAAQNAAGSLGEITLSSSNVSYTVNDCSSLEKAAMRAAIDDANARAAAFADSLGVKLGSVVGANDYSFSPYGGSPCGGVPGGPVPLAAGATYVRGGTTSVQVFTNISVTYAIG